MSIGPILIFDKSLLQSLSIDESVWLDNFFMTNIVPTFFIETLADIAIDPAKSSRDPHTVVSEIADKTPILGAAPNVHHSTLVLSELMGEKVEMRGVPVINGGTRVEVDGKLDVVYEQAPEFKSFERWKKKEFALLEQEYAGNWRQALSNLDFQNVYHSTKKIFEKRGIPRSLTEVKELVDKYTVEAPIQHRFLKKIIRMIPARHVSYVSQIRKRWEAAGKPILKEYAPYSYHVLNVDTFFEVAIAADLVSRERPSNKIDFSYLYYLPFCMVFTSTDSLHRKVAPLYLTRDQSFVWGNDLKADLKNLDKHYSELPDEIISTGVFSFAISPPEDNTFLVSKLWDKHLPEWRTQSVHEKEPIVQSDPKNRELVERMNKTFKLAKEQANRQSDAQREPDGIMIQRFSPARRGKWQLFSQEVIDSAKMNLD